MYDIYRTEIAVYSNVSRTGFRVVINHDGEELWKSWPRADILSANGLKADLLAVLADARCNFCNEPAYRYSDIGDLEADVMDFNFWCMRDSCHAQAVQVEML